PRISKWTVAPGTGLPNLSRTMTAKGSATKLPTVALRTGETGTASDMLASGGPGMKTTSWLKVTSSLIRTTTVLVSALELRKWKVPTPLGPVITEVPLRPSISLPVPETVTPTTWLGIGLPFSSLTTTSKRIESSRSAMAVTPEGTSSEKVGATLSAVKMASAWSSKSSPTRRVTTLASATVEEIQARTVPAAVVSVSSVSAP